MSTKGFVSQLLGGYHVLRSLTPFSVHCAAPRTVACQTPLSMEFSRQERWSRLSFPTPGDCPDPGIEPTSLISLALAGGFFTARTSSEAPVDNCWRSIRKQQAHRS